MCHAAVANSGEQEHQRRRPLAAAATDVDDDGGGGRGQQQALMPGPAEPVMETAAAPWQSSRQAREMSAMVAALATVVAGSEPPPPPPAAKGPAQAQAQDASMDEAWWPYEDLQVGEPSSPARFVLQGKSVTEQAGEHMLFFFFVCMHYSVFSTCYFIFSLGYLDAVVGRTRVDDLSCIE